MASRIMPISTIRDQQARVFRRLLPAVLLSVVVILAVVAPAAISLWLRGIDPQVDAKLQNIQAGQQQTTSGIEPINDRPAAEGQFIVLSARLSTLQDAMTRVLRDNAALAEQLKAAQTQITQMAQDNAALAEQLGAAQTQIAQMAQDHAVLAERFGATQTQITQMAQNNASVAEQLKALTQMMAHRAPVLAMGSDERERRPATTGSNATSPAATRSRTAYRSDQARLRVDGGSGAAGRSRASPAPTARLPSPQLPP